MKWRRKPKPLQATPSPAFLRAWLGHTEHFAVNLGLAPTALEQIGHDFDAVEWDWPRWGRRILVSGPWPGTQRHREVEMLRRQERDRAALKLMRTYAYDHGVLDAEPGKLYEVPAELARGTALDWRTMPLRETQKLRDWPIG